MSYFKVITPVATEPVTLAEVKRHLRIYDDGYNDTQTETVATGFYAVGTQSGISVDVNGCEAVLYANVGSIAAGGTLKIDIQHSADNITYDTWESFTLIDAIGSYSKAYEGGKRYIKAIAIITVNNIIFGVNITKLAGDPTNDAELLDMITRAREEGEEITRLSFAPQTLEKALDTFPCTSYIELPRPPMTSITSVKIYSSAGVETTLTPTTQYLTDTDSIPGRVVLPYSGSWPSGADYPINPIKIRYLAGYTTLPQKLKNILLYHVGLLYKFRDSAVPELERQALERMYNFYRVSWFGGEG